MFKLRTRMLALAGGSLMARLVSAQSPFFEDVTATHLPAGLTGPCMDAAAGDADGDDDLDLALAMEFQPNILLLNDGSGRFTDASTQLPRTAHDSEDVAFADFDADGDLDLVFVSEDDRQDELWLNDGTGNYLDASEHLVTDDVSNAHLVIDLNADGFPDLLTGNIGLDLALINDGRGNFRDDTAQRWPQDGESRTQDLEAADVDRDGDLDVMVANEGQNQLFLNEDGILKDVTASHLPQVVDETREIRAVDVDGDGDVDLLVANVDFLMEVSPRDYLLLNDGKGVFTQAAAAAFPEDERSNFTIQTADLDRDGDLDALAPSTVFSRGEFAFVVVTKSAAGAVELARAPQLQIDDVDMDGDFDVTLQDGARSRAYVNDGTMLTAGADESWPDTVAMQDIDARPGEPTLSYIDVPLTAMMQSLASVDTAAGGSATPMLQLIDLGNDGTLDIAAPMVQVMASVGNYLVLMNDGAGGFTAAAPGAVLPVDATGNGFDIEVADFDADGVSDLFLCNRASIASGEAAATSGGLQRLLKGTAQ